MDEYQETAAANSPSGRSSSSIEPWRNRSPGFSRRAIVSIGSDRSRPKTDSPRDARYAVTRPGPQPRSATSPPRVTSSAKPASSARSNGFAVCFPANISA